ERDGSEGHVFQGGDIVAPRGLRSAPALGQPVLIELDVNLAAHRPQGENVAHVVAVQFAIPIQCAAVYGSEPVRTVVAIEGVRIQINPMNLDKGRDALAGHVDRKSTRLNSSHGSISYAVFCLKKKKIHKTLTHMIKHNDNIEHND